MEDRSGWNPTKKENRIYSESKIKNLIKERYKYGEINTDNSMFIKRWINY